MRRLLCLIFALLCCGHVWAEVAANVVFFTGQPTLTAADGKTRKLARGDEVRDGETIDTGDGRVQLRFRDGATMSLQPATRFRVERFRFSGPDGSEADGVVMTLVKGALRTVTGLLGKRDRTQYKVGTTVATIGIRGTEYGAVLDGSGLTVTTYVGVVEVCSQVGCVDVEAGRAVWVRAANAKPELRDAGAMRSEINAGDVIPEAPIGGSAGVPSSATPSAPTTTTSPTFSPTSPSPTSSPRGSGKI